MKEITTGFMILAIAVLGYGSQFCFVYEQRHTPTITPTFPVKLVCLLDQLNQPDDPPRTSTTFSPSVVNLSNIEASGTSNATTSIMSPSPSAEA